MPPAAPSKTTTLLRLARKGPVRARDLDNADIPRAYLKRLCDRGLLEQIDRGLYRLADAPVTELSTLAEVSNRVPHAVICLLSALQVHGMTTEAPPAVWVLIDRHARMPKVGSPTLEVVRASGRALEHGVETRVIDGVKVQFTTPAKTVADCFRFRRRRARGRARGAEGLPAKAQGQRRRPRRGRPRRSHLLVHAAVPGGSRMTKTPPKDIGASVRARPSRLARERGEDFQLVLTRYANERLLFRLASSRHAQRFVLKGAALFTLWTGKPHRATRDLDLLGFGEPGVDHVREVFAEVLALDVPDDGVRFDLDTLAVGLIREEQEYGGVRVEVIARITNAQVRLQVDVGFGDAITPEANVVELPPLLDFPAPRLRAYPRETVVAEKLEAMVQLGMANSRMKDFYDVAVLAQAVLAS